MNLTLNHVVVATSHWESGDSDTLLDTRGLTWCVGIAIHDSRSRIGHLLHSVGPKTEESMVNEFFNSALTLTDDPKNLSAWVRGNHTLGHASGERDKLVRMGRAFVESSIADAGILDPNVDIRWGDNSIDMVLDCSNGRLLEGHTVYTETTTRKPLGMRYLTALQRGEEFLDDTQEHAAALLRYLNSIST